MQLLNLGWNICAKNSEKEELSWILSPKEAILFINCHSLCNTGQRNWFLQEAEYSKIHESTYLRNASSLNYRPQVMNANCQQFKRKPEKSKVTLQNWLTDYSYHTVITQSIILLVLWQQSGSCGFSTVKMSNS